MCTPSNTYDDWAVKVGADWKRYDNMMNKRELALNASVQLAISLYPLRAKLDHTALHHLDLLCHALYDYSDALEVYLNGV